MTDNPFGDFLRRQMRMTPEDVRNMFKQEDDSQPEEVIPEDETRLKQDRVHSPCGDGIHNHIMFLQCGHIIHYRAYLLRAMQDREIFKWLNSFKCRECEAEFARMEEALRIEHINRGDKL